MRTEADADAARTRSTPDVVIIVPCFNEADRLDLKSFEDQALATPGLRFLFVDDGSEDATRTMLEAACRANPHIFELLALDLNRGKAEAVRAGVLHLESSGPRLFGFWDADLATPLSEIPNFLAVFESHPSMRIVMGSRVNLLGRQVSRRPMRHYVSRTFATLVAVALKLPVYDSQCGAKLFRGTADVYDLFREPFHAHWIFDTELLIRAIESLGPHGSTNLGEIAYELPLTRWEDVDGSKIRVRSYAQALRDTARIYGHRTATTRFGGGLGGMSSRLARSSRTALRRLTIEDERVSLPQRLASGAALVPIFGALLVWMRTRAWLLGPLRLPATTRSGLHFQSRLPDLIQTYLYLFGIWEPDVTDFIEGRLRPGDTFIDVGANIGYHSLVAQRAVGSTGAVVAIEASPQVSTWLHESITCNDAKGEIRVVHAAASDHRGELTMYAGPARNTGLATSVAGRGLAPDAVVPCAPLPDLLEPHEIETARIVKIDVEGGEDVVIRGLGSLLADLPSDVEFVLELSPQWWADTDQTPSQVLAPFFDAGFHAYEVDNDLWPWRYLWPNSVRRPRRCRRDLSLRPRRIDLVLSRLDVEIL